MKHPFSGMLAQAAKAAGVQKHVQQGGKWVPTPGESDGEPVKALKAELGQRLSVEGKLSERDAKAIREGLRGFPQAARDQIETVFVPNQPGERAAVGGHTGRTVGETVGRQINLWEGFTADTVAHETGHVVMGAWINDKVGPKGDAWIAFIGEHAAGFRFGEQGRKSSLPQETFADLLSFRAQNGKWPGSMSEQFRQKMDAGWVAMGERKPKGNG